MKISNENYNYYKSSYEQVNRSDSKKSSIPLSDSSKVDKDYILSHTITEEPGFYRLEDINKHVEDLLKYELEISSAVKESGDLSTAITTYDKLLKGIEEKYAGNEKLLNHEKDALDRQYKNFSNNYSYSICGIMTFKCGEGDPRNYDFKLGLNKDQRSQLSSDITSYLEGQLADYKGIEKVSSSASNTIFNVENINLLHQYVFGQSDSSSSLSTFIESINNNSKVTQDFKDAFSNLV